jgi:hypothetical protein
LSKRGNSMHNSTPKEDARTALWLRRWTVAATLALLLSTNRLWIPADGMCFPQIPFFLVLCKTPFWVDLLLLGGLLVGMWGLVVEGTRLVRNSSYVVFACGTALVLLDQHRLQPWFYQLLLFALIFTLSAPQNQIRWMRILVISIYSYSALGKLDFEFFHTVGQQFLDVSLSACGVDVSLWPLTARLMAVAMFPLAELLLAAALLVGSVWNRPTLLRIFSILACIFHLVLLLILGLGLRHSLGVVLWNLQFAVQALMLFGNFVEQPKIDRPVAASASAGTRSRIVQVLLGCALVLPLLERLERWDHWPSWALYAPHSSRVELFVAQNAVEKLPESLQRLMSVEADVLWVRVPIAQWSIATTATPIYPQARFELGVCRELAEQVDSEFAIRAVVLSSANRLDGHRTASEMLGSTKIAAAAKRFSLNTQPRGSNGAFDTSHGLPPVDY